MTDDVHHPKHYTTHPSGVEVIEITRNLPFSVGNAVKYVLRRDLKGKPKEDLDKALWYLNDAHTHQIGLAVDDHKAFVDSVLMTLLHEPDFAVKVFLSCLLDMSQHGGSDYTPTINIISLLRDKYS